MFKKISQLIAFLLTIIFFVPAGLQAQPPGGDPGGLAQRVAALESLVAEQAGTISTLLAILSGVSRDGDTILFTGVNVQIVNGLGETDGVIDSSSTSFPGAVNGLGNLFIGYNEARGHGDDKTGSHNLIIGPGHNYSSYGGLVAGAFNTISGNSTSVSGGNSNTASGRWASVSGGSQNTASGIVSSVSGGAIGVASGEGSNVSGGLFNTASGEFYPSVSGGSNNTASGLKSSVCGGWSNEASGENSNVSGGNSNLASGLRSSVGGGHNRNAPGENDWAAGSLFEDF